MNRIAVPGLRATGAGLLALALATPAAPSEAVKSLRYALPSTEYPLDPVQAADASARTIAGAIFEAPLEYEFIARPFRLRPNTAQDLPVVSADFKTFTFRIRPGIYFTDDPAFKGRRRELTAEDYVYSIKRIFDPRWRSPSWQVMQAAQMLGLAALRDRAIASRQPFDYDTPVAGLRTLDRYRFQIQLALPAPRFLYNFTDGATMGAVAREVVEAQGDAVGSHPVGTGPYTLGLWKTAGSVTLLRNAGYRDVRHDEHPDTADAPAWQAANRLRGRALPLVDRVTVDFIDTPQNRWLAFLQQQHALIEDLPADAAELAGAGSRLQAELQQQGVQWQRATRPEVVMSCFNMTHPQVGGYAPEQLALRRAVSLGIDLASEIRLVRRGQALPAQSPIAPGVYGHDAAFKSEMGDFSVARARALLDLYGYLDRDGDGWREAPDGKPLALRYTATADAQGRQLAEQWRRNMSRIGLRIDFDFATAATVQKASRAGSLMVWNMSWRAGSPDGEDFLDLGYVGQAGNANRSRFDLPAYNQLYEMQMRLPDGPARAAVMREAQRLWVAYMPCKVHVHRVLTDLTRPSLLGYRRNPFVGNFWKYVDIDPAHAAR